jgi:hypothetical protein
MRQAAGAADTRSRSGALREERKKREEMVGDEGIKKKSC